MRYIYILLVIISSNLLVQPTFAASAKRIDDLEKAARNGLKPSALASLHSTAALGVPVTGDASTDVEQVVAKLTALDMALGGALPGEGLLSPGHRVTALSRRRSDAETARDVSVARIAALQTNLTAATGALTATEVARDAAYVLTAAKEAERAVLEAARNEEIRLRGLAEADSAAAQARAVAIEAERDDERRLRGLAEADRNAAQARAVAIEAERDEARRLQAVAETALARAGGGGLSAVLANRIRTAMATLGVPAGTVESDVDALLRAMQGTHATIHALQADLARERSTNHDLREENANFARDLKARNAEIAALRAGHP